MLCHLYTRCAHSSAMGTKATTFQKTPYQNDSLSEDLGSTFVRTGGLNTVPQGGVEVVIHRGHTTTYNTLNLSPCT